MGKGNLQAAGVVVAAVAVAYVFYVLVVNVSRGGVLRWPQVVEGLMIGAVVVAAALVARTRRTAAVGLATTVVVMLLGLATDGGFGPALAFAHAPLSWALVVAFAVRLAVPSAEPVQASSPERATLPGAG